MNRRAEVVPPALAGQRIDRVVALIADVSRADAARLVDDGRVEVDGRVVVRGADRVEEGAAVSVTVDTDADDGRPRADPSVPVPVVHADGSVIVVDKPAGLVVHPGAGNPDGTLVDGLLARFPEIAEVGDPDRPGIVHRLDRDTSGLLVVARTPEAHRDLVDQLARRSVHREYRALVAGHPDPPRGLVDAPIGRSPRHPTLMAVRAEGREARTGFAVLATFDAPDPVALVECRLETGRTHQIRVHMQAIGHPIVGDDRYGGGRTSIVCDRPFLHAAELGFAHPDTGEEVHVTSALPPDLAAVLDGLGGPDPTA